MTFQKKGKARRGENKKNEPKGKKSFTSLFIGDQSVGFPSMVSICSLLLWLVGSCSYLIHSSNCPSVPAMHPLVTNDL